MLQQLEKLFQTNLNSKSSQGGGQCSQGGGQCSQGSQEGGDDKMKKMRAKLNAMTCVQLREKAKKIERSKNVKISVSKKKDGKTVYIKKASLVNNILKYM
jgi:hypothetical protein